MREIYEEKIKFVLLSEKQQNFQNYGINLIFNGEYKILNNEIPKKLIDEMKKKNNMKITESYLSNQVKNMNLDSLNNLKK